MTDREKFVTAYADAALATESDNSTPSGGYPLDRKYGLNDFAPEAKAKMDKEAGDFYDANADLLLDQPPDMAGYHLWLSRNGHGSGYWTGDYAEEVGAELQRRAEASGERNVYIGDDGLLYYYPG
jgi:hypothetical protein